MESGSQSLGFLYRSISVSESKSGFKLQFNLKPGLRLPQNKQMQVVSFQIKIESENETTFGADLSDSDCALRVKLIASLN